MALPFSVYKTQSTTDAGTPDRDGTAVTGTTTYYSETWTGQNSDGFSASVFYTGTPTGTFTLWGTDKPFPDETTDNDWIQDANFVPVNPAGAAGKFGDDASQCKKWKKRLKYVNASGTGVVFAYVNVTRNN